jgi:hypothetical protein
MLAQIEVLLAFAAVMAAISLIITVLNQTASSILGLRGLSLRWGLSALLKSLYPDLDGREKGGQSGPTFAEHIVNRVLLHPLISDSVLPVKRLSHWRLASAIRFEEFKRAVTLLAKPEMGTDPDSRSWTHDDAVAWLSRRVDPIGEWFTVMMDRVTQHFTLYMRVLTVVFGALVVFTIQLDAIDLYNRLNKDVKLRNGILDSLGSLEQANAAATDASGQAVSDEALRKVRAEALAAASESLRPLIASPFSSNNYFGMFVSVALLSLGAPFWFNQLKNLSNLRSVVAAKEQKERDEAAKAGAAAGAAETPKDGPIAAIAERREGRFE